MAFKVRTAALSSVASGAAIEMRGKFNASIRSASFVGTVKLERSYDNGSTWEVVSKDASGNEAAFTTSCSIMVEEPELGVQYRWNCTAYTSGTANTRISQ